MKAKELRKFLRYQGQVRAWRIHNFIFAQDKAEDATFYVIHNNGQIIEIDAFPILYFSNPKQKVKLEGVDFMEYGNLIFGKDQ